MSKYKPGDYFHLGNHKEAEEFIGREVTFLSFFGRKFHSVLKEVTPYRKTLFIDQYGGEYTTIQLTEESFKEPVDNKGLIKALKKSILQWTMMIETGKTEEECYEFLGGKKNYFNCFLCEYSGYRDDINMNADVCENCISWFKGYCWSTGSEFQEWCLCPTKANAVDVLERMKSELRRLENNG